MGGAKKKPVESKLDKRLQVGVAYKLCVCHVVVIVCDIRLHNVGVRSHDTLYYNDNYSMFNWSDHCMVIGWICILLILPCNLVPRPIPRSQCCMLKNWEWAWE